MARAAAEAIYADLLTLGISDMTGYTWSDPELREQMVSKWAKLIAAEYTSHSIEFPFPDSYSTYDPAVASAFRAKYPELEPLIAEAQDFARQVWPKAEFGFYVTNDPEGCHTCHEGQALHMDIFAGEASMESRNKEAFEGQWEAEWAKNQQFMELLHGDDTLHTQVEWGVHNLIHYDDHATAKDDFMERLRRSRQEAEEQLAKRRSGG